MYTTAGNTRTEEARMYNGYLAGLLQSYLLYTDIGLKGWCWPGNGRFSRVSHERP